jgi:predicted transcriptional regulator
VLKNQHSPGDAPLQLSKRERQIADSLYRRGEAAVADVLTDLPDPPTYSAVRALLNGMVKKQLATTRQDGKRYLYRPVAPKEKVRRSALKNLVRTFFAGTPADAVAALLDGSAGHLTPDDLHRIRSLIDEAEKRKPQ